MKSVKAWVIAEDGRLIGSLSADRIFAFIRKSDAEDYRDAYQPDKPRIIRVEIAPLPKEKK